MGKSLLSGVPGHEVRQYREKLEPYLREFLDRGVVTVDDLIDQIEARDRQLWIIAPKGELKAVALTRLITDRITVCEITHLTGAGYREWQDAILELEQWARAMGCARLKAIARPGWSRISKRYGLRKTHEVLEKDL